MSLFSIDSIIHRLAFADTLHFIRECSVCIAFKNQVETPEPSAITQDWYKSIEDREELLKLNRDIVKTLKSVNGKDKDLIIINKYLYHKIKDMDKGDINKKKKSIIEGITRCHIKSSKGEYWGVIKKVKRTRCIVILDDMLESADVHINAITIE